MPVLNPPDEVFEGYEIGVQAAIAARICVVEVQHGLTTDTSRQAALRLVIWTGSSSWDWPLRSARYQLPADFEGSDDMRGYLLDSLPLQVPLPNTKGGGFHSFAVGPTLGVFYQCLGGEG